MNVKLFSMFWGDKHLDLFKRTCFESLHWPRNKAALAGAEWQIFTKPEHFTAIHNMFIGSSYKLRIVQIPEEMELLGVGTLRTKSLADNFLLLRGLTMQIAESLQDRRRMLFAPPDTIFGDGTIHNMLSAGRMAASTVQVGHIRVNPSILEDIKGPLTNPQLVTLGMKKHLHKCWTRSESGSPEQATFKTGVIWQRVEENLYEVKHQLPTTYLVDFTPDDWQYWSGTISFGSYDHQWPENCFVRQERQRYIGSSDSCFIVEITDEDKNTGEVTSKEILNQVSEEMYFNWRMHNSQNKQHIIYFRGE